MLSTYSKRALPLLLEALPEFKGLVKEEEGYFVVKGASPSGLYFAISSDDEQITVCFAEYHCHFCEFDESLVAKDVNAAVSFIQDLQKGDLILAAWYQGKEYAGSYPLPPEEAPEPMFDNPNLTLCIRRWSDKAIIQ
jgi:hypothetical protein